MPTRQNTQMTNQIYSVRHNRNEQLRPSLAVHVLHYAVLHNIAHSSRLNKLLASF